MNIKQRYMIFLSTLCGAAGVYLMMALYHFNPHQLTWFHDELIDSLASLHPSFSSTVVSFCIYYVGGGAYGIPLALCIGALLASGMISTRRFKDLVSAVGIMIFSYPILAGYYNKDIIDVYPGGWIGQTVAQFVAGGPDRFLYIWFCQVAVVASFFLFFRLSLLPCAYSILNMQWIVIAKKIVMICAALCRWFYNRFFSFFNKYLLAKEEDVAISQDDLAWASLDDEVHRVPLEFDAPEWQKFRLSQPSPKKGNEVHEKIDNHDALLAEESHIVKKTYRVPPVDLLASSKVKDSTALGNDLKERAAIVEEKLAHFGVKGTVVSMTPGPVVTLFEFQPDIDIKVSRILALEDDLALALKALSLRIIAPIPGKSVVGFEVANAVRETLFLAPLISSKQFSKNVFSVPVVLGHDTSGLPVIIDVAAAPHLLIAGSTGSGKSVALNVMLASMLYKRSPDELRLILIDPKRLEFSSYADIPHLLCPIITHPSKAVLVLKWVVATMEHRYETMAGIGVKNIADYKQWCLQNKMPDDMPSIVVMIDELADLMLVARSDIEDLLARISQMARAAGIHLIVATQRPSVDVITGVIKVNFPSRIAFKVASKIDSRTILDSSGAEKLLGRGDMLYLAPHGALSRLHGAYISAEETLKIVEFVKSERPVSYVINLDEAVGVSADGAGKDALYAEIVSHVKTLEEISISSLQRSFKIGYNRSARIIEMLERDRIITPADGSKMRRVIK